MYNIHVYYTYIIYIFQLTLNNLGYSYHKMLTGDYPAETFDHS